MKVVAGILQRQLLGDYVNLYHDAPAHGTFDTPTPLVAEAGAATFE